MESSVPRPQFKNRTPRRAVSRQFARETLRRVAWSALPLCALATPASAADAFFSLTGAYTSPGLSTSFTITPTATGPITAATFHHTGGVNAAGQIIPGGSFDPLLALAGDVLSESDDNGGPGNDALLVTALPTANTPYM